MKREDNNSLALNTVFKMILINSLKGSTTRRTLYNAIQNDNGQIFFYFSTRKDQRKTVNIVYEKAAMLLQMQLSVERLTNSG